MPQAGIGYRCRSKKRPAQYGGGRHLALLRNTIIVPRDEVAVLDLGYSDDATEWLNGTLVFRGFNGFNARDLGFSPP